MNTPRFDSNTKVVSGLTELVRGQEKGFLDELAPVVSRQSVCLDLSLVERIDAAGLAALITLYCDACKAGHRFRVARPGPHVREILSVVGLDKILLSSNTNEFSNPCMEMAETAA
jgi:anti-anti-sigma factor